VGRFMRKGYESRKVMKAGRLRREEGYVGRKVMQVRRL
jgi:hypothetical protein